jgi:hypothetical protein
MAIQMALHGGIGFIHYNNTIKEQRKQVDRVKNFKNGFISNPKVITPFPSLLRPPAFGARTCRSYGAAGLSRLNRPCACAGAVSGAHCRGCARHQEQVWFLRHPDHRQRFNGWQTGGHGDEPRHVRQRCPPARVPYYPSDTKHIYS